MLYLNFSGGEVLAVVTCVIELWMLWQSIKSGQNPGVVERVGWGWIIQHRIAYVIQLTSAVVFLAGVRLRRGGRQVSPLLSAVILGQFVFVCVAFGLYITLQDISHDHAMYALLTELVALASIFSIRPILFVPAAGASLSIAMSYADQQGLLSRGEGINLAIFMVFITISCGVRYYTTMRIARNNVSLNEQATTDGLTGLKNTTAMQADMRTLADCRVTVSMLDINGLKACNDRLGHSRGNAAIVLLARALVKQFRGEGSCYRVGGDEFMVATRKMAPEEHRRRIHEVEREFEARCRERGIGIDGVPISVATGTVEGFVRDACDVDALYRRADEAMYQQKHHDRLA